MPSRSCCSRRRRTVSCRRSTDSPAGSCSRVPSSRASPSPRPAPRTPSARSTCSGSSPTDGFVTPDLVRDGAHGRHARARGESRRLPHRLPRRPDGTARGHRRSPADRRRDPGVRRRGRRLCGGRRRLRQRLQVAAGRPGHRVRAVQRACARAHRARALGFAGTDDDLPVDVVPPPAASAQAFTVSRPDSLAHRATGHGTARCARRRASTQIEAELSERTRRRDLLRRPLRGPGPHAARAGAPRRDRDPRTGAAGCRARSRHPSPTTGSPSPCAPAWCGSPRTSAPAPTRCASSATRWPRSRRPACGDSVVFREFTHP